MVLRKSVFTLGAVLLVTLAILVVVAVAHEHSTGKSSSTKEGIVCNDLCDLYSNPEKYEGKEITAKGKISSVDSNGKWFKLGCLEMKGMEVHVDCPKSAVSKEKIGSVAKVTGTVKVEKGKPTIICKKVEFEKEKSKHHHGMGYGEESSCKMNSETENTEESSCCK